MDSVCEHMGGYRKWDEESIRAEALKYKTRWEFQKGSGGAQIAARRLGIMESVCEHMGGNRKWDEESIRAEASKYETRKAFKKGAVGAYQSARRLGIMDDLFPKG